METRTIEPLLSVKEAALSIGVCPKTMRRWAAQGRVPSFMVGKRHKFDRQDLLNAFRCQTLQERIGSDVAKTFYGFRS